MSEPDEDGMRAVFFKINGQTRSVFVRDESVKVSKVVHRKASAPNEIGCPLQGRLTQVLVKVGDKVAKNQPLFTIEAMKMESTVVSPQKGKVRAIHLADKVMVGQDDLVVELE